MLQSALQSLLHNPALHLRAKVYQSATPLSSKMASQVLELKKSRFHSWPTCLFTFDVILPTIH
jgi:hypothetical protein